MGRPRYRTLRHGADLRVAVWGDGEEELVANAVLAAMTLALGAPPRVRPRRRAAVRSWPDGLPMRLVRAVNESLFALYARREVAVGLELKGRHAALLVGALPAGLEPELEVKAATFHDLRLRRRHGRLRAILTLDV